MYVKNFKTGYEQYKKKFKTEKDKYKEQQKADLFGVSTDNSMMSKVSLNDEIAYSSFNKLEQAQRSALKIEGISTEVMMEMHNQSENMKGITGKVKHVGEKIDTSSSLITEMDKRHKKNKTKIIIFGFVLVLLFLCILIFRFIPFRKGIPYTDKPFNSTLASNNTGS